MGQSQGSILTQHFKNCCVILHKLFLLKKNTHYEIFKKKFLDHSSCEYLPHLSSVMFSWSALFPYIVTKLIVVQSTMEPGTIYQCLCLGGNGIIRCHGTLLRYPVIGALLGATARHQLSLCTIFKCFRLVACKLVLHILVPIAPQSIHLKSLSLLKLHAWVPALCDPPIGKATS